MRAQQGIKKLRMEDSKQDDDDEDSTQQQQQQPSTPFYMESSEKSVAGMSVTYERKRERERSKMVDDSHFIALFRV